MRFVVRVVDMWAVLRASVAVILELGVLFLGQTEGVVWWGVGGDWDVADRAMALWTRPSR